MKKRSTKLALLAMACGGFLPLLGCLSSSFFQQVLLEIAGEAVAGAVPFPADGTDNNGG